MADDEATDDVNEKRSNARKVREGIAVSTKMDKTVVVAVVDRLSEAKQELWKRRLDLATGQLDGTSEITNYKREIARIHTLMREREISAHEADRRES